jgi:molecular chaperone DnaJ
LSKKWHPDKHKGDKDAEQKFKEINEAYEVLGNEKRKAQYDQFGTVGGGPGGGGFGGFDFSGFQQSDMGDLGDIFSSFFGGGGGGRSQRPRDQRGGDLQVRLAVEFSEIVTGTKKTITIEKLMMCTPCTGTGSDGGKTKSCEECGGTGQITRTAQSFFGTIQSALCSRCQGSGTVPENPCAECKGEGRSRKKSELTIDIPAGIHDGQTLRIKGQGDAGRQGDASGDLFVILTVKTDPNFVREGDDIRSSITVPVVDAILGTDVSVKTVHGDVTLKIPAGTQPNYVMRLKGKGLPVLSASRMGDHYVNIIIEVPKKLSRSEKKLMDEWKSM